MVNKITVIGAGNVGATVANDVAIKNLAEEVILIDIVENLAEGKALDMWESSSIWGFHSRVKGVTNDYAASKDSDIIVITAGKPRKPGMSRDDLISTNAKIVNIIATELIKYSPNAIFIVVTNPLDVMTYAVYKTVSKYVDKPRTQVFGMAGTLDVARYKAFIAEALNVSPDNIQALLMGGHGDTMVPLPRYTSIGGVPLTQLMDKETIDKIIVRTQKGGGEIVQLLGTSAWYAPGAAIMQVVEAVALNKREILPVCAYLNGEYGYKDIYIGVPVILGKNGIEKVVEIELNEEERAAFDRSAEHVKEVMKVLDDMAII